MHLIDVSRAISCYLTSGPRSFSLCLEWETPGVLSYHLHQPLISLWHHGTQVSHQIFHDNLVTLVYSKSLRQNPMHYGTQKFSLLKEISWEAVSNFMSVSENGSQQFVLEAGKVHGVHHGDKYAICHFASPENALQLSSSPSLKEKAFSIGRITSILETFGFIPMRNALENAWKAKPLTHCSPRQVHIK